MLAILAPVIILMSTSATLIGAGSHLIGIGLLKSTTDQSISYIQWFIWGVPFTIVISVFSVLFIKWILWPKGESEEIEDLQSEEKISIKKQLMEKKKRL